MDNFVKSFWDEWASRAKNPLIASFILAHIALNWQAYSLLIWATPPFEERMELFRLSNGQYQLVWQPLFLGILLVVVLPIASFGITFVNKWATTQHKLLIERQGHTLKSERARLEDEREVQRQQRVQRKLDTVSEFVKKRSDLEQQFGSEAVEQAEDQLSEKIEPEDVVEKEEWQYWSETEIFSLLFLEEYADGIELRTAFDVPEHLMERLGHTDRARARVEIVDSIPALESYGAALRFRRHNTDFARPTAKGYAMIDRIKTFLWFSDLEGYPKDHTRPLHQPQR